MEVLPKVDDTALKILFLLIPGIVTLFLVKSFGPKRPRSDFESGLQIFLYGLLSYAVTGVIKGLLRWMLWNSPKPEFWKTVGSDALALIALDPQKGLGSDQIALATASAVLVGVAISVLQTYSVPHHVMRFLKLTKRTGEVDIWSFAFNSPDLDTWVTVRHPSGKVYQGWVRGYSDEDNCRELLLVDVRVYAEDPQAGGLIKVDDVPVLYLGVEKDKAIIEMKSL